METEKSVNNSNSTKQTGQENGDGNTLSSNKGEEPANSADTGKNNEIDNSDKKSDTLEVDDVPDAFFDDFLDNDFMEGLDIVDDVDDEETESKKPVKKTPDSKAKQKPQKPQSQSKPKPVPKPKAVPKPKSPTKPEPSQRDPSKTKRDMENYKIKYNKDKQMKLISQRLDSGLVPPGMEMDIETVVEETPSDDLREKIKQLKSKAKGMDEDVEEPKDKQDKSKNNKSKSNKHSSMENPRKYSPPHRKTSPLRISPINKRKTMAEKSIERKISPLQISPVQFSREKSRTENRRSKSPGSPGRRRLSHHSRSPIHKSKERAIYKPKFPKVSRPSPPPRHNFRRSRSPNRRRRNFRDRSRSFSPLRRRRRSRTRSRSPRGEPKKYKYVEKTFLEEIAEKLSAFPSHNNVQYPSQAAPSNVIYPHVQQTYDQQFFLGNTNLHPQHNMGQQQQQQQQHLMHQTTAYPMQQNMVYHVTQQPQPQNLPTIPLNPSSIPPIVNPPLPIPKISPNLVSVPSTSTSVNQGKDLAKLYEDKKISLSDYLCISSRPEVQLSNPEQLKEKIKVISRCQDAIKFMDHQSKFKGKLPANVPLKEKPNTFMYQSPLVRNLKDVIPFTTPPKKKIKRGNEFAAYLDQLLITCGVKGDKEENVVVKESQEKSSPLKTAVSNVMRTREGRLSKMVQTEPQKCKKCEHYKRKKYSTVATQCEEIPKFSIETQVTEDDLLPKKRSLAALTPAQLLGKKREDPRANQFQFDPPTTLQPPRTFQAYNPLMQQQQVPFGMSQGYPPMQNPYGAGQPRYGRY